MTRLVLVTLSLLFVTLVVANPAPLFGDENVDKIAGKFIVIYHENTTTEQALAHSKMVSIRVRVQFKYDIGTFKGFAAALDEAHLEALLNDPMVKEIHYDSIVRTACTTQEASASWGLPRVSTVGRIPNNGLVDDYHYDEAFAGEGVDVYVIDTGIYIDHNDFGGRASWGENFIDAVDLDQNGHGTHCAGTVAGNLYGVAKKATVIAVKVLGANGSGTLAGVVAGIQWVTQEKLRTGRPSVASMSLGAGADSGMGAAIRQSVLAGVTYSVAAGNSNFDACRSFPAASPDVICVGASTLGAQGGNEADFRATFSNYGRCVTLFAPGQAITSSTIGSRTASSVLSGTSMACPHVSGAAAILLSQFPDLSPDAVRQQLIELGTRDIINNVGPQSPNLLLHTSC